MQRRTAVAAASAISVSLVSAVIAGAASFGVLGFAAPSSSSAPPAGVTTPAAATTPATDQTAPPSAPSTAREHEREAAPATTSVPYPTGGHESDD